MAATSAVLIPNPGTTYGVSSRRFVLSQSLSTFDTELDNTWANQTLSVDPFRTAVVLIDVWNDANDPMLHENEVKRILPLLQFARRVGMLVIHAPSEGKEWSNITVLPGELLVTGTNGTAGSASRCDVHTDTSL